MGTQTIKNFLFLTTLLLFLVGCGGGGGTTDTSGSGDNNSGSTSDGSSNNDSNTDSGDSTTTPNPSNDIGYLIDAPIAGIKYTCGTITGITDSNGTFEYKDSQCPNGVIFSISNLTIGVIEPDEINPDKKVTIQDMVAQVDSNVTRADINNTKVIQVAQFLQSLDLDGNASNGIDINSSLVISQPANLLDLNITEINATIENLDGNYTLKDENETLAHLEESMESQDIFDRTPDSFTDINITNVMRDTNISFEYNVSGLYPNAILSISDGNYSYKSPTDTNWSEWSDVNLTVSDGYQLQFQHTSDSAFDTNVTTTVSIGTLTKRFTSFTELQDTTPDDFTFSAIVNAEPNSEHNSSTVTISGINDGVTLSVENAQYSIDGGDWNTTNTQMTNNQTLKIKATASSDYLTETNATITIGTLTKIFSITTREASTIPLNLSFNADINVSRDGNITTNQQINFEDPTISGVSISIVNGEYCIGNACNNWTSTSGTISDGDILNIRHTASSDFNTETNTTIIIGGEEYTFSSTTEDVDNSPDDFSFIAQSNVNKNSIITSDTISITGINVPTSISITNGQYSINGGDWNTSNNTISNNDDITVRHTTPFDNDTNTTTTLIVGDKNASFVSTTNDTAFTAVFSDGTPIQGVKTSCNDVNNSTGSSGEFSYGCEKIEFYLNTLKIGDINYTKVNPDGIITPQEIVGNNRNIITSQQLSKVVMLLHSLDDLDDSFDGITINDDINLTGHINDYNDSELIAEIKRLGFSPKNKFESMHDMLINLKDNNFTITDFVTYPEHNSTDVGPYTLFKIGYGEEMDASTLINTSTPSSKYISPSLDICDYNNTAMVMVCYETSFYNESQEYTYTLTTGNKNILGERITSTSYSFTTGLKDFNSTLQTGQGIISYKVDGNETGDDSVKDDGYYTNQNNGLSRNFTSSNDIVTDTVTGLMWQDDAAAASTEVNGTYITEYCDTLNLNGITNWRVPTKKEFNYIANKGAFDPTKYSEFQNVASANGVDFYWTADFDPADNTSTHAFSFYDGIDLNGGLLENNTLGTANIRCVKGDKEQRDFVRDDINEIVIDTKSGLMWQDDNATASNDQNNPKSWYHTVNNNAIDYCSDLGIGTFNDWRLPNYNELLSLINFDSFDSNTNILIHPIFKNALADTYWTSTSFNNDKTQAWVISFGTSSSISNVISKGITSPYIRCVRGGNE